MAQSTFLDRLKQEQQELQEKKIKLADFLSKPDAKDKVGHVQHMLLVTQLTIMNSYNTVLEARILDLNQ